MKSLIDRIPDEEILEGGKELIDEFSNASNLFNLADADEITDAVEDLMLQATMGAERIDPAKLTKVRLTIGALTISWRLHKLKAALN